MNIKKFSEVMGEIDVRYVDEALNYKKNSKRRRWMRWGAAAACLAAVLAVCLLMTDMPSQRQEDSLIRLSENSENVVARYIEQAPSVSTVADLQFLTEEEIFSASHMAVFRGTVLGIRNIELDFNGDKAYRAIAEIRVEEVAEGPCAAGDSVSVLLPCPITEGVWVEDTDVVSAMRVGTEGIFMPMIYDNENSVWIQNNARLIKKDIADYGFSDGVRYAFLQTEDGLIFSRYTYESISDAATLDEIWEYVQNMLERYHS